MAFINVDTQFPSEQWKYRTGRVVKFNEAPSSGHYGGADLMPPADDVNAISMRLWRQKAYEMVRAGVRTSARHTKPYIPYIKTTNPGGIQFGAPNQPYEIDRLRTGAPPLSIYGGSYANTLNTKEGNEYRKILLRRRKGQYAKEILDPTEFDNDALRTRDARKALLSSSRDKVPQSENIKESVIDGIVKSRQLLLSGVMDKLTIEKVGDATRELMKNLALFDNTDLGDLKDIVEVMTNIRDAVWEAVKGISGALEPLEREEFSVEREGVLSVLMLWLTQAIAVVKQYIEEGINKQLKERGQIVRGLLRALSRGTLRKVIEESTWESPIGRIPISQDLRRDTLSAMRIPFNILTSIKPLTNDELSEATSVLRENLKEDKLLAAQAEAGVEQADLSTEADQQLLDQELEQGQEEPDSFATARIAEEAAASAAADAEEQGLPQGLDAFLFDISEKAGDILSGEIQMPNSFKTKSGINAAVRRIQELGVADATEALERYVEALGGLNQGFEVNYFQSYQANRDELVELMKEVARQLRG